MIPRIANRGHSFKGAGLYYLHDKEASTTERVAWTQTRNIPTNEPEAATRWMAYTAINSNKIKQDAAVPLTGRKRKKGVVYTFSLSWSPDENPDREHMEKSADETLELLGLKDHQSLIVAHNDTEHPHVHVICNLINPNDGRMHDPDWGSKLKMSEWSLKHEFENGKIYCEQRVENNEKRKRGEVVKYQEPLHERKAEIQNLYNQSDNGNSFITILKQNGYTLAKGNRRRFVLVDDYGRIHSLSRQLSKEQRTDHLEKLSDLKQKDLPIAKNVAIERQHFDRDKQEMEQLQRIEDAAIEKAKKDDEAEKQRIKMEQIKSRKNAKKSIQQESKEKSVKSNLTQKDNSDNVPESVADRFDRLKKWENKIELKRQQLKMQLAKTYERDKQEKQISELEKQIAANDNFKGRMSGQLKKLKEQLEAERLTLANIDQRIAEQQGKLDKEIEETRPSDYWGEGNKKNEPKQEENQKPVINLDEERKKRKEDYKEKLRQQIKKQDKNRDNDKTLER